MRYHDILQARPVCCWQPQVTGRRVHYNLRFLRQLFIIKLFEEKRRSFSFAVRACDQHSSADAAALAAVFAERVFGDCDVTVTDVRHWRPNMEAPRKRSKL